MSDESESRPITLEMIEKHLRKIENDGQQASVLHPLAVAVGLMAAGIALVYPTAGWGLFVYGALMALYTLGYYCRWKRKH